MEAYKDRSLRGRVFQKIREDILQGVYKEHDELREVAIGEELGVSRTPVREALRQLELEGLVTIVPNKGAYVTGITQQDIHDIYVIRSSLEGICARWATRNITQEQIDELEEIILLSEFHIKKQSDKDTTHVTILDGKFHSILYTASGSRILEHELTNFHKYVQLARKNSVRMTDRAAKSIAEHRELLEAIKAGDEDLAEQLARQHMINVMKNLHIEN